MPRRVIQIKVCDMAHDREVEAVATETFALNGYRYKMDLCLQCSAKLAATIGAFADNAVLTGEPSVLERRRETRTIVLDQPTRRPAPAPVAAELRREEAMTREPLPQTAYSWVVTPHAEERMGERDVDLYEVLMTAERPERDLPSTNERHPESREYLRGDIKLFVNPRTREVLTVARLSQSANEPQKVSA